MPGEDYTIFLCHLNLVQSAAVRSFARNRSSGCSSTTNPFAQCCIGSSAQAEEIEPIFMQKWPEYAHSPTGDAAPPISSSIRGRLGQSLATLSVTLRPRPSVPCWKRWPSTELAMTLSWPTTLGV